MTVEQVISELEQFPMDMEVKFSYNFGDYWKTEVASDINSIDVKLVKYSSYHNMDKIAEDEEDDLNECIIIS